MKRPRSVSEPSAPASFAALARKLSGWTTNLLATGLILVLALGVGRQLVGWWRIEPDQALPTLPTDQLGAGLDDPAALYTLEFGDSPFSIDERTIGGDRAEALRQLTISCGQAAAESASPVEPAGEAEKNLLETVRLLEPLETAEGFRLYGPDSGFPFVVAVAQAESDRPAQAAAGGLKSRENTPETSSTQTAEPSADAPPAQLGASRDRVLVWGIAAPAGDHVWSLYTFRLGQRRAAPPTEVPGVSLPPGSRRTMAIRDWRGETLLGFAGSDGTSNSDSSATADEWRRSLALELKRTGWSVAQDWQLAGDVWRARYVRGETSRRWTADVQFGPEPSGQLSGLVRIVPPATDSPASRTDREQR